MDRTEEKNKTKRTRYIAVTAIVIISTIIAAGILYTWSISFLGGDGFATPMIDTKSGFRDANFSVTIVNIEPDAMNISYFSYRLLDNESVPGTKGDLADILNMDPDHEDTSITFLDLDRDEYLSIGDMFLIKHRDFGGKAEMGYRLKLIFIPYGETINGGGSILG